MTAASTARQRSLAEGAVVTKAVLRGATRLGLSNKALARMIGISEASVSRMSSGTYELSPGEKAFEISILFLRLFRSLDAIVGGDETSARSWMRSEHAVLGQPPAVLIQSLSGLIDVVAYLDARRAVS